MLSEKLKKLREISGLSQSNIAKRLNISRQCYGHYETGAREPNIEILKKLCIIFGVSADELLEIQTESERKKILQTTLLKED